MTGCRRCLYLAHHPLGLLLDDQGICTGCRVHEEKDRLDWAAREARLMTILDAYRSGDGRRHDCIVPVSGGKDSFFVVDRLKRWGMNPLLVSFNRVYNSYAGIFNLEQLRTRLGADIVSMTLAPDLHRRLAQMSLDRLGSFHWPYLAGSTVFPVQMAVSRRIPLIVWGAHQGLEQVGMFSHLDEVEMTRRYRKEHDLMGLEPEDVADDVLPERDLAPLFYPDDRRLNAVGVRGIYLGNYLRWDTRAQHIEMLAKYDYCAAPQPRTFDTCTDVDCLLHGTVHDAIKVRKWGYGKATDHACREIRFGRMTREQGLAFVAGRQSPDADAGPVAEWLGLSVAEFWAMVDRFRRHHDPQPAASPAEAPAACAFPVNLPARMARAPFDGQLLMRGWAPAPGDDP